MSNLQKNIKKIINQGKTILCVGPMSKNCVDAAIELSDYHNIYIFLIASRRQVDSQKFGGGYVNNWSTKEFSKYVKNKCKRKKIILARDHGGPWQNFQDYKNKISLKKAINNAKYAFKDDIDNGFKFLHLDTSVSPHFKKVKTNDAIKRLKDIYSYLSKYSKKIKKEIIFEIGTEEQSGTTNTEIEIKKTLSSINMFCKKKKIAKPLFMVMQTGTKVLEDRNVGSFESPVKIKNELSVEIQLPKMLDICTKYKIYMKQHNTDYLSNESLKWHPKLGIHAANVAPEFAIVETRKLLEILKKNNMTRLSNELIEISFKSGKWKKWVSKNSNLSRNHKALLCAHYVYSKKSFSDIITKVKSKLNKKKIYLDNELKKEIKKSMMRYLKNFNMI